MRRYYLYNLVFVAIALALMGCSTDSEPEAEPPGIRFNEVRNAPMEDDTSAVNIEDLVDFGSGTKQSLELVSTHPSLDAQVVDGSVYNLIPQPDANGRMYVELQASNTEGVVERERVYFNVAARSDLQLQLVNGFTGQPTSGYLVMGSDSLVSEDGFFDVQAQDPGLLEFRTGLLRNGKADSYSRISRIAAGEDLEDDAIHHVHFGLYDADKNLVSRLRTDGYDKDGPMDVERMKGAAAELHFFYRGHEGLLHRYTGSENGMNPDKIVIAKNVTYVNDGGRTESFGSDYEEVVSEFSKRIDMMNEVLAHPVSVETVENFSYNCSESVQNMYLVGPDSKLRDEGVLGKIAHFTEGSDRAVGARVKIRTPKPVSASGQRTYFVWLPLHEIGSIMHNSSSRPIEHVNFEESVLSGGSYIIDDLEERLPVLDTTMGLVLNNADYPTGMQFHDLYGLPEGFSEVNYDFSE